MERIDEALRPTFAAGFFHFTETSSTVGRPRSQLGHGCRAHGLMRRVRGFQSSRCLFLSKTKAPFKPLHFPALSSPSDQRAALLMKRAAHYAERTSAAPPHHPPTSLPAFQTKGFTSVRAQPHLLGRWVVTFLSSLLRAIQAFGVQLGGRRVCT